ncbi:Metallo-beta-lactamase superfamily protein [Favolaschia claudopus]|uniref:Metallo-beta-lactamase superfamily protein n=1 Tax=Favolaschia claudopus TaxID=2862362 RepID=A0AAW0DRH1_9AGAR
MTLNTVLRSFSLLLNLLLVSHIGDARASYRDFNIPPSKATVDVRVFNVANLTLVNTTHAFILPVLEGHESAHFPMYSFLVEHKKSSTRLMFDLGIRQDPENTPPSISFFITAGLASLEPYKDITQLLQNGGIGLNTINGVIWSHAHFDHVGDMSKFPNSTNIIIGPETDTSIFPENPNATLQASDFAGHNITKLDFASSKLVFAGLKAVDYFGDGSFYLVDTPGHLPGHLTALARVTSTSFVVLGGDTFHHAGQARPRPQFQRNFPCPAHLLEDTKTSMSTDFFWSPGSRLGSFDLRSRAHALLTLSDLPDSFYADPVKAGVSLEKVASFDADPDFLVVAAHDISIRSAIPYFPKYINGWKASKLKERTVWNFVDESNPAFVFSPINSTK